MKQHPSLLYFLGVILGIVVGLQLSLILPSESPAPATSLILALTVSMDGGGSYLTNCQVTSYGAKEGAAGFLAISPADNLSFCVITIPTSSAMIFTPAISDVQERNGAPKTNTKIIFPTSTDASSEVVNRNAITSQPYTAKELCNVMGVCNEVINKPAPQVSKSWMCRSYRTDLVRRTFTVTAPVSFIGTNTVRVAEQDSFLVETTGDQTPESMGYSDCTQIQ